MLFKEMLVKQHSLCTSRSFRRCWQTKSSYKCACSYHVFFYIFRFFAGILKVTGPLPVDDKRIQEEMDVFPYEAVERIKQVGGLADFLKMSLQFAVIDDVIALLSDAKSARQLALVRRKDKEELGQLPSVPDAWKTVGKSVNDVDSLRESVTGSDGFPTLPSATLYSSSVSGSSLPFPSMPISLNSTQSVDSGPSYGKYSSSLGFSKTPQSSVWPDKVNSASTTIGKKIKQSVDLMDSIDDFPAMKKTPKKGSIDDIDDDEISDSESDYRHSGSSFNGVKLGPMSTLYTGNVDTNISRSSSKSDMSDRSNRSDVSPSVSNEPKPMKPLTVGFGALEFMAGRKGSGILDKGVKDFDSASSVFSRDDSEIVDSVSLSSLSNEVQKAGEEFVRKSDEKFVAELAESVVEKLYEGKTVSESEKQETLRRVSSDIWKDFERSAKGQKSGESDSWSNTSAGADYSKNLGKFATDFMKKHYENSDGTVSSPTSNFNIIYPQDNKCGLNSLPDNNPGFNSVLHLPTSAISSESLTAPSTFLSTQTSLSDKSGYNLFSSPTWGFNSFQSPTPSFGPVGGPRVVANATIATSAPPLSSSSSLPSQASMPGMFIRPPHSASTFYQTPTSYYPPNRPSFKPSPMGMAPQMYPVIKTDQGCQCGPVMVTKATMTDTYEPYKLEYLNIKEEREKFLHIMTNNKLMYDKLLQEYNAKDQKIKVTSFIFLFTPTKVEFASLL